MEDSKLVLKQTQHQKVFNDVTVHNTLLNKYLAWRKMSKKTFLPFIMKGNKYLRNSFKLMLLIRFRALN